MVGGSSPPCVTNFSAGETKIRTMKHILIFLILSISISAQQIVFVTRVIDGDTFQTQQSRYRISEIDAPELGQQFGIESKNYLSKLILYKKVKIIVLRRDRYGRQVVKVFRGKEDIAESMIKTGHAWWYRYYSKNKHYKNLEDQAKIHKFGLWKHRAVNPYKYRNK